MKKQITTELLEMLIKADFTASHYKIYMILMTGTYTQMQIADKIGMKRQNVNKYIADLIKQGYVKIDRTEGRNKYLKANVSVTAIQKSAMSDELDGQLSFETSTGNLDE